MDLASAVQILLAYEASLKLAPGQKPPTPSPSLFTQLSDAVRAIAKESDAGTLQTHVASLPPSVWSDWPLCCGVDLTPKELKAARSLSPSLLRSRGLLSLFLALQSCAAGGVGLATGLGVHVLRFGPQSPSTDDPASAQLAARVGHRLINAEGTLDFLANKGDDLPEIWDHCFVAPYNILASATAGPNSARSAVPHEAAGFSLAKEAAVMLDALSTGQPDWYAEGRGTVHGQRSSNSLSFWTSCQLVYRVTSLLHMAEKPAAAERFLSKVYTEAAALPAYDPVFLLQSFYRNMNARLDNNFWDCRSWSEMLTACRDLFWAPLIHGGPLGKLRPADGYIVMRLGLEDLTRQETGKEGWTCEYIGFAMHALQSGLVQPELILRARPQLFEGLVEGLAKSHDQAAALPTSKTALVTLLTRSPAVGFHLRKFFSRSGCLQAIQGMTNADNNHKQILRLLGPRAAQSDTGPLVNIPAMMSLHTDKKKRREGSTHAFQNFPAYPHVIIESVLRDLTLDILREPRNAQLILQYLSELCEEIAAPKRPQGATQYGALMVIGLGKACLAFSTLVARALKDISEADLNGKGVRGLRGTGSPGGGVAQLRWRNQLVSMEKELSVLRRRVLHELLPLAEAREAALWEGVREEEVVAALRGDA